MIPFLSGLGAWNWLIFALVLFALEAVVPGVNLIWFGSAALVVGLLVFATGITWPWQLVVFAGLSICTAFVVRRYARAKTHESDLPDLNVRAAQYIGREFVVVEPIKGGRGRVKVGDTVWPAEGDDVPAGSRVRVTSVRDSVLMVERVAT